MNVLIVDDQISVISSLTTNINWNALGIDNVCTALNAMEARSIITDQAVDILLCDIEMPVENGLSLLRWCRDAGYAFECILLTSHADFLYAQEAIKLKIFDYILQPARYEDIEKVISRAVAHIKVVREKTEYARLGELACSQKNNMLKNILHDWLDGKPTDLEEILSYLQKLGICLTPDTQACLLLFQIINWHNEPLDFSQWSRAAETLLEDIFSHYGCHIFDYCPDRISLRVFLYGNNIVQTVQSFDQSRLSIIQGRFNRTLSCSSALYVAPACVIRDLPLSARAIAGEYSENITLSTGIFHTRPEQLACAVTVCSAGQLDLFRLYLTNYQTDKAAQAACIYLDELNRKDLLNHETLLSFCNDYLQAAYGAAKDSQLAAHMLPSLNEFTQSSGVNFLNIQLVEKYIQQLTAFFESHTPDRKSQSCHLTEIERYINANLEKPLPCADVARAVHLSPDYITRLFQSEKGISLKEYITQSKILAARRLLFTTTLPVSVVASKVGYDNFSHFSKVYKKVLGHSPSKDREHEKPL